MQLKIYFELMKVLLMLFPNSTNPQLSNDISQTIYFKLSLKFFHVFLDFPKFFPNNFS